MVGRLRRSLAVIALSSITMAIIAFMAALSLVKGQTAGHGAHMPYAGQHTRAVKSLSESDMQALKNGSGWGLAKAAELNGLPGPLHVLELADEMDLTPEQRAKIEQVFADMRGNAQRLGGVLIAAERRLDVFFQSGGWKGDAARERLAHLVQAAAQARGELRLVHLKAHLEMAPILSARQIARYNQLRGYGKGDPCAAVPKGHDPVMWRRHNGCN